jgi:hypothetical protein
MNAALKPLTAPQLPHAPHVFDRHFFSASVATGKCEACGDIGPGLAILPASMCATQICAHCFFDLHAAALALLSREYVKWART